MPTKNVDYRQTKIYYVYAILVMVLGIGAIIVSVQYFSDKLSGTAIEHLFTYIDFNPVKVIMALLLGPLVSAIIALAIYVLYRDFLSKIEFFNIPKNVISKVIALIIIIIFILLVALLSTPQQFAFLAALVSIVSIIWNLIERASNENDVSTGNHNDKKKDVTDPE